MPIQVVDFVKQCRTKVALHLRLKQSLIFLFINVHAPLSLDCGNDLFRIDEERRIERIPLMLLAHARRVKVLAYDVQVQPP